MSNLTEEQKERVRGLSLVVAYRSSETVDAPEDAYKLGIFSENGKMLIPHVMVVETPLYHDEALWNKLIEMGFDDYGMLSWGGSQGWEEAIIHFAEKFGIGVDIPATPSDTANGFNVPTDNAIKLHASWYEDSEKQPSHNFLARYAEAKAATQQGANNA